MSGDPADGPSPTNPTDGSAGFGPKLAIVRREIASLRSEKTIVLALTIQLFIAAFSSFLVVGLVSLYDPSAADDVETEIAVVGDEADRLLAAAERQDALHAETYPDAEGAHHAFDGGQVAAVLEVEESDDGRLFVDATAPDEGLGTTVLVVQLQELLETVEHTERIRHAEDLEEAPLQVPSEIEASPYVSFTYTILIPLLLFLPVFISGSIAVDSMIEERERGTLELLRVAPPSFADVVDAKLAATAGLAPIQAVAWLVLLALNGTAIAYPAALVVLVSVLALLIVGAGVLVALTAPDRRQAQLWYSGGIVAALVGTAALPEHPTNTVAKLAIGSPSTTTWLLVGTYAVAGIVAFIGVRLFVSRLDHESL